MERFSQSDVRDRVAFVDVGTGKEKTYGELQEESYSFANALLDMGVKKGDCVAIMAPNHVNYFSTFIGIALTGAYSSPINPSYTETEVKYQLEVTEPKLIVTHSVCEDVVMKVAQEKEMSVISMGGDKSNRGVLMIDDIVKQYPSTRPGVSLQPKDTLTVPFSSGTSGQPK